jgi:hypothetical protein
MVFDGSEIKIDEVIYIKNVEKKKKFNNLTLKRT